MSFPDQRLSVLKSFVPRFVLEQLEARPHSSELGFASRSAGVVLAADIVGFTSLAERITDQGPRGVEELSALLNLLFGKLVRLIGDYGGDIVCFAGDAPIVLWRAGSSPAAGTTGRELGELAGQAAGCGLALRQALDDLPSYESHRLSLRMAIAAGTVLTAGVGGVGGKYHAVVAGEPMAQLAGALRRAGPGELVLTDAAWGPLGAHASGHELGEGFVRLDACHVRFSGVGPSATPPTATEHQVRAYIPECVLARLDAAQTEWVSELRRVSPMFLQLQGLACAGPDLVARLQQATCTIQEVLGKYEGTVVQVVEESDGLTWVLVFGVPPYAHEDDAARAAEAALEIRAGMAALGWEMRIGITTGRVFCGERGNPSRREYSLIGDRVNLAARLMQYAPPGALLTDVTTASGARGRLSFRGPRSLTVKGKTDPLEVYEVEARATPHVVHGALVGRSKEQAILAQKLEAAAAGDARGVIVEGEPGVGKTRLVAHLLEQAAGQGIVSLTGYGGAIEQSFPFHAWRHVFARVLNLAAGQDLKSREETVLRALADRPDLLQRAPLLNHLLSLRIPENETTRSMVEQVRADNTMDLLLHLLDAVPGSRPLVIVLEDAHWFDSRSWALVLLVLERMRRVLLVLTTRPSTDPSAPSHAAVMAEPRVTRLGLGRLATGETAALLGEKLGVATVPETVVRCVQSRSGGNPLFSEQLCCAIRDAGLLEIQDGRCALRGDAAALDAIGFPDSVHGVVISRIDRLSPGEQLTLKVASVFGRTFSLAGLEAVFPVEADRTSLPRYLRRLSEVDLTVIETTAPTPTYAFTHAIVEEAAYQSVLFAQRERLHRAIAEWYERDGAAALETAYATLAHHWVRANVNGKAILYLARAGEQSLHSGAYQEAVAFLTQGLARCEAHVNEAPPSDEAPAAPRLERMLAEAILGLGKPEEGRRHLERALELWGMAEPATRVGLVAKIGRQILVQAVHRLWPAAGAAPAGGDDHLEAARTYIRLVEVYWFANDTGHLVHAGLRALNLAETGGPTPELARAYAIMCIAAGSIPLHGLADLYGRLAMETAERVGHLAAVSYALFIRSVYGIGSGKWSEIDTALSRSVTIFEQLGDTRLLGDAMTVQGMSALYRGEFHRAHDQFDRVWALGCRTHNEQHQIWSRIGKSEAALRLGRPDEAIALLMDVLAVLCEHPNPAEELRARGLLAGAFLRKSESAPAEQHAQAAAELIAQLPSPTSHYLLEGYAGVAEIVLMDMERRANQGVMEPRISRAAAQACRRLRQFARVFSIGSPRAAAMAGWRHWLEGRRSSADRLWQESLRLSARLSMPYETALVCFVRGRLHGAECPIGREDLGRARELFRRLGCADDLRRTESELRRADKCEAAHG